LNDDGAGVNSTRGELPRAEAVAFRLVKYLGGFLFCIGIDWRFPGWVDEGFLFGNLVMIHCSAVSGDAVGRVQY
jgi:hypothetical protein